MAAKVWSPLPLGRHLNCFPYRGGRCEASTYTEQTAEEGGALGRGLAQASDVAHSRSVIDIWLDLGN